MAPNWSDPFPLILHDHFWMFFPLLHIPSLQITVHNPICRQDGDLSLALYGSFLPAPALEVFDKQQAVVSL